MATRPAVALAHRYLSRIRSDREFIQIVLGSRIGKYRIVALLGEGGMGAVYKAIHEELQREVAIKVLHAKFATRDDMMTRFKNEARAANIVKHPSLVEIYDTDRLPDGSIYLVMELLDGEALDSLLERRGSQLPLKRVLRIGWQLADALTAVHSKNIVHRDLKPSNVMLVRDSVVPGGERIKVLDFGIAKIAVENAKGQARTATGMMLGTIFYVAPEQCQSAGSVDGKADVYSLGAMLFELSTGKLPFDGENEIQIILQHVQVPAPKAIDVAPSLPLAYSDLIERMMAKDRTVRPTMLEVAAALHEIDAALNLPEPPADDPPRPKLADLPTAPLTIPQSTPQEALGFTAVQIVKDSGTAAENAAPDRKRQRSLSGVATDPSGEGYPGLDPEGNERNKPSLGPWIGAALGSLVVVFGVGYFVKQRAQPADGAPPNEVRSAVAPPTAPPAKSIRWTLRTVPPDAEVLNAADGSVIGKTPFVKNGLSPMAPLTVTLRKDGFVEQRLSLPEDRDFEQSVTLAVVAPAPAPASVKVTKAKRRAEPTNAKGTQVAQPAGTASPPPAAMPLVMPQMAVPRVTSPRLTAPEKKPSP